MTVRFSSPFVLALAVALGSEAQAQFTTGFEPNTYAGSPAGTVLTGQDGFYIPVAGSQDGLVMTYAGNALGLPLNPTGGTQFAASIGADPAQGLPQPFSRAQRDITYGSGTGVWTASFDIAAATALLGAGAPFSQNIGSFSTQVFPGQQSFIGLARWANTATGGAWNADYVWFNAAGTQLTESVPDPAFQNLAMDHWYRWGTTFDLGTNQILSVSITDLTTNTTVVHNPVDRYLFGGAAGAPTPTGFRLFGGTNSGNGNRNALAWDNVSIIPAPSAVALLGLAGLFGARRRRA